MDETDLEKGAALLEGCSGADIENITNLVALQVVRKARIQEKLEEVCISPEDFREGVNEFVKERKQTMYNKEIESRSNPNNLFNLILGNQ